MKINDRTANDIHIAYIGGGSRGWAWGLMADLALEAQMNGVVSLYDIDYDAAKKNSIIANRLSQSPQAQGHWSYTVKSSLKQALQDADFVIISILPGTFEHMYSDVHTPQEYGIYQSVGDTVGPGGLMRALRAVPMFKDIALAIKEICPDAWVINYTNPMSVCIRTLYSVFPRIKAFGCCHEVFGAQSLLARMLEDTRGIKVERNQIDVNVLGINHFTWFDTARYCDIDLMPLYRDFVQTHYEQGYDEGKDTNWMNNSFCSAHRVKFDLFRRYGYIAAAGDRHLAEFCPRNWYLSDPETVRKWRFALTGVDWRIEDQKKKRERCERILSGDEELALNPSGEEGHLLIKALLGLGDMISNVNLPNIGQISNLPIGAVVESNAVFRAGELRPVMAGAIPENISGLILRHVYNQQMTVKAALDCDRELAFSVFVNDPLTDIKLDDAKELFDAMISNSINCLPKAWQNNKRGGNYEE